MNKDVNKRAAAFWPPRFIPAAPFPILPGRSRFFGSPCFFLILVLFLALGSGCSNYTGSDWASVQEVQQSIKVIVDYNLKNYVSIPTIDGAPTESLIRRGDMIVTVVWKILESNNEETSVAEPFNAFEQDTVYRAYITLEARNNYYFDLGSNFFYPDGAVEVQPSINPDPYCRVLTPVTSKPTETAIEITDLNLTPYIPAPVTGQAPARLVNGAQYSGLVTWDPNDNVFEDTGYTAAAVLYPRPGFVFGENGQFTHSASNATVAPINVTGSNVTIVITFSSPAPGP
jgi:hypothetical protein